MKMMMMMLIFVFVGLTVYVECRLDKTHTLSSYGPVSNCLLYCLCEVSVLVCYKTSVALHKKFFKGLLVDDVRVHVEDVTLP